MKILSGIRATARPTYAALNASGCVTVFTERFSIKDDELPRNDGGRKRRHRSGRSLASA